MPVESILKLAWQIFIDLFQKSRFDKVIMVDDARIVAARRRIRVFGEPAYYHCMSRIVAGAHLLKAKEKEVFRKMLRKQAAFCGVEVVTFAIMSNHFHVLVRVTPQEDLPDAELVERVRTLYGDREADVVALELEREDKREHRRERLLARMGDVSAFLKELKQRFSIWYNKTRERYGTLWAERFKSVLIQGERELLARVAAYIDLNAVRAGLVEDPKDYRYCGYAEAVVGSAEARSGLCRIFADKDWARVQKAYRLVLFGFGYHTQLGKGRIREGALRQVFEMEGGLSPADVLRCRVRYFSDGLALGSAEYIEAVFRELKQRYWRKRKEAARAMRGSDWKGVCTLSRMRGPVIGF